MGNFALSQSLVYRCLDCIEFYNARYNKICDRCKFPQIGRLRMCMCLHTGDSFEDDLAKSTRIHLGTHMAEYVSVNTEHFGGSDSRYIGSDRFREFEMILSELLRPSPEVE